VLKPDATPIAEDIDDVGALSIHLHISSDGRDMGQGGMVVAPRGSPLHLEEPSTTLTSIISPLRNVLR
jgi:hypothetical protein